MIEHDLTPEQRAELGDLSPVYNRLRDYEAPMPDSALLLAALKPEFEAMQGERVQPELQSPSFSDWLRLAWQQTQLLGAPFWLSALVLVGLGLICSAIYGSSLTAFLLLLVSPLFAVGGVAYLFRPATRTLWELEQFSRFSPLQLLYARLLPVLLLNVVAVGLLVGLTAVLGAQVVFWRLLVLWLGPMLGFAGIALFCSIRWNTIAGISVPALAWAAMLVLGWGSLSITLPMDQFTIDLFAIGYLASDVLLAASLILLIVGVLMFYVAGKQAEWRSSFAG